MFRSPPSPPTSHHSPLALPPGPRSVGPLPRLEQPFGRPAALPSSSTWQWQTRRPLPRPPVSGRSRRQVLPLRRWLAVAVGAAALGVAVAGLGAGWANFSCSEDGPGCAVSWLSPGLPPRRFMPPPALVGKTIYGVKTTDKVLALTFDDGPRPGTSDRLLQALARQGVVATFFWTGYSLRAYPQVARRVVQAGHAIGNHTWSHTFYPLDAATAGREIDGLDRDLQALTGVTTRWFRPPGGLLWTGTAAAAAQRGYAIVHWSQTASDTDPALDGGTIAQRVVAQARPGAIVLLHDDGGGQLGTVAALEPIIRTLRSRGYRFLTVPQLLALYPPQLHPPQLPPPPKHHATSLPSNFAPPALPPPREPSNLPPTP